MVERIFDRRGRRNWDDKLREKEDRRILDRRRRDRRRGERRKEQRRKKDLWAGDPTKTNRRVKDRRVAERRQGDRRGGERRHEDRRATATLPSTIREVIAPIEPVHSLPIHSTIEQAMAMMAAEDIGLVAVLSDDHKLTGVFSERDVVRAFAQDGAEAMGKPIEPHVTRGVWTCKPEDSPYDVIVTMSKKRMRHMPVMDGNVLVGMVSTTDLLQFFSGETEKREGK